MIFKLPSKPLCDSVMGPHVQVWYFFTVSPNSASASAPNLRLCRSNVMAQSTTFHGLHGAHQLRTATSLYPGSHLPGKPHEDTSKTSSASLFPFFSFFLPFLLLFSSAKVSHLTEKKLPDTCLDVKALLKQNS